MRKKGTTDKDGDSCFFAWRNKAVASCRPSTNRDELKREGKARHGRTDFGGIFFLENEELQPVGSHFRNGARWTHQCSYNWMSKNAKGLS